ncbi:MAG: TIGR01777 family oxidoreductase [Phycisphaeraceae bacterium]
MTQRFEKVSSIPAAPRELFDWHVRPGAFQRLTPPWQRVEVVRTTGEVPHDGSRVELRIKLGPVWRKWLVEHRDFIDGQSFTDVTLHGPFPEWTHHHRMEPADETGQPGQEGQPDETGQPQQQTALLRDTIDYRLPGGDLGRALGGSFSRKQIQRGFDYRHATTAADLRTHQRAGDRRLTVAVTGSHGLIGSALCALLTGGGHRVIRLVRGEAEGENEAKWSPGEGLLEPAKLEGVDAVVHLAGENIVGRWTPDKRRRIRESRETATKLLARGLAELDSKPSVLISASAVGIYGDRGGEVLHEDAEPGEGFLADVALEWERAADPAREAGIRVVHPRIGMVLTPAGGALQQTLPVFQLGLGGVLGSGRQVWPWITLDDVIDAMHFALFEDTLEGPVNFAAPESVTNRTFTKTLGRVLGRPTLLPVPKFAPRLAFGELADALLFASIDARPAALQQAGFPFRQPTLEGGLRHVLGR